MRKVTSYKLRVTSAFLTVLWSYGLMVFFLLLFAPTNTFAQTDYFYTASGEKESFKVRKDRVLIKCQPNTDVDAFLEPSFFISASDFGDNLIIATIDTLQTHLSNLRRTPNVADVTYALEYRDGTIQMPMYEIFLKPKEGRTPEEILRNAGLEKSIENISLMNHHSKSYLVKLNVSLNEILPVCRNLYELGECQYVEPAFIREMKRLSNPTSNPAFNPYDNPQFKDQWGLKNDAIPGLDINIMPAWNITKGSPEIIVAVLDEGVKLHHIDLEENILHECCYDATRRNDVEPGGYSYRDGHGTMCAGIIGAVHNDTCIIGVAPECKMVSIRIGFSNQMYKLGRDFPYGETIHNWITFDKWIARGITYAYDTAKADVLSNSWGGGSHSDEIAGAFEKAVTFGREGKGCVIVAASGNHNPQPVNFPARLPYVIAVGAILNDQFLLTDFSNNGDFLNVVAPGVDIYTTSIGAFGTSFDEGTSLSCPFVSGIAALVLSINPCLEEEDVRKIIAFGCKKIEDDGWYDYYYSPLQEYGTWNGVYGYGLVDAYKSVMYALSPPEYFNVSGDFWSASNKTFNLNITNSWIPFLEIFPVPTGNYNVKKHEIRATVPLKKYTLSPVIQGIANGFSIDAINSGMHYMDVYSVSETEVTVRTYVYEEIDMQTGATLQWLPTHPDNVRFHFFVSCNNFQQEDLYLQNETETSTKIHNVLTNVWAGNHVNPNEPAGDYIIHSRGNVSLHAGEAIILSDGFTALDGSCFHAYVEPFFTCTYNAPDRRCGEHEYASVIQNYSVEKSDFQDAEAAARNNEFYLKLYPNPSNGNLTIEYNLNSSEVVEITLNDNSGKPVYMLKNRTQHEAGVYKIMLTGVELPNGIYYCTLKTENGQKTEKLMIVR